MKITWVVRGFSNYRVPVYKALDDLCGHELTVIYYKECAPENAQKKLKEIIGVRAIARDNEIRLGNGPKFDNGTSTKKFIRIPFSPGLISQILKTKPDVLISDTFTGWTYAPLTVNALKGIPHVMCYERTAHTERKASMLRKYHHKFVSRWIDTIDCNGKLSGEFVKDLLGWKDDRLTYGHMVADVSGMKKGVEYASNEQVQTLKEQYGIKGTVLLFVGQIISRKGVKEMVEAWNVYKKQNKETEATLVIVGKGWQEEEIRALISKKSITNVVFTGAIDYQQMPVFYRMADCFVLPTLEDNWSLVIPEAMACGLPVATTIYNGCYPELVKPENGWVFDSLNKQSIVDTFRKIIEAKDYLKEMGQVSKRIVAGHTAENAAKGIMEAIEKANKRHKK